MKKWADRHRQDLQFEVDDWVYIRLRPRRQSSMTGTTYGKLKKRYVGPFKITRNIGEVAYEVDLPPTAKIHNVFHVNILRPHKGPIPSSPLPLPPDIEDNQPVLEPAAILDQKWDNSISPPKIQVLIQWQGLPLEEASWEPWLQIQQQFDLEDKVFLEPGGDVRAEGLIPLTPPRSPHTVVTRAPAIENLLKERVKRITKQPRHQKDYVVTCQATRKKGNFVSKK
ncbi:hypothetical protein V8G54_022577 [Vigna mungo]|uniref:Chromo domain-containing protein n=1 Tax=Vigna mungo TaxID=3915 RepID=A0AAQ3RRS6_VIGMU